MQLREIPLPAVANAFRNPTAQAWICVAQPTPWRHTIRLIAEPAWKEFVEIRNQVALHQLRMQRSHAVYRVTTHNGEVGHPNHTL